MVEATHGPWQCKGTPCPFHNPSDHHMSDWPTVVRYDQHCLTERVCPHGVGHPDPDSLEWLNRGGVGRRRFEVMATDGSVLVEDTGPAPLLDSDEAAALGVHGCDGCCANA